MAHEQSKRQSERSGEGQSGTMARTGGGERGIATRQYQDPFSFFDSLFERMQRDFFGTSLLNALVPTMGGQGDGGTVVRVPRVNVRDTGDALELTAELPGVETKNVSVEIEDNVLTIGGEQEEREERGEMRSERYISFYRQIPLPDGIDTEQAQANFRNGMLTIKFPKAAERSSARRIPVSTEASEEQSGRQQQPQSKERAA